MTDYIGIIGLGNAGSAVASALAKKTRVIGFDVNPDCKNAAEANGIRWANDYQEIAEHADKIILSLPKPESSVAITCLLYTSPSPRDLYRSRMPSSA